MPRIPNWIFLLIAVLYFSAIRVDLMDIDATQYAEISREMAKTGDYLHLYDRGNHYLDKPPMLFWLSATSIRLFGANNLGYKLPSLLLALLALYATYRLGRKLYDDATGRVATLILGTTQGMFLMTNDIRCDTALMSWVIIATWLLYEWSDKRRWYYLLGGSTAIACAMMTKGPIGLLAPAFALLAHWIARREWRHLFRWEYLPAGLIIILLLLPMSIGLYQQYDLHKEIYVNGERNVSGLRFFYWTQSFGRITGENVWNNGADISFQLVNMLWSFLPWIFLLLPAIFFSLRTFISQKFRLSGSQEFLSTGGFLLCYLAVGMSKYQLPHYIFVAFPFAAILCAGFVNDLYNRNMYPGLLRFLSTWIYVCGILLFVGVLLILSIVFPAPAVWFAGCAVALCIYFFILLRKNVPGKMILAGATAMLLINVFLTHYFYYELMQFQVGNVIGQYIRNKNIPNHRILAYRMHDPLNSMHFYADRVIPVKNDAGYIPNGKGDFILTQQEGLKELEDRGFVLEPIIMGELFKVSELTGTFLNKASRREATSTYYFCRILKQGASLAKQSP